MTAAQFNKLYPVGTLFIEQSKHELVNGRVVKTVAKADDLKCGAIVEISLMPYFVKIDSLKPAK
ncbi:hypothetical protein [Serratia fonticola]|jgi:hypothetical protein|uniref:hypothetical protein n=1 Tax=Serratia fonticola TaxID=47917 RepID=UPI0015C65114|nr:hypothetical protein [Serratia fonticola]NYA16554.1 hypothetical protein [Serratia fonticola]NYA36677.1 hypothetical protein [Serratia fonticola]